MRHLKLNSSGQIARFLHAKRAGNSASEGDEWRLGHKSVASSPFVSTKEIISLSEGLLNLCMVLNGSAD
ncbi:MAG: hypothetical protein JW759_07935, partial [Candidatus Coatesbacteria bacterium]|nr:hypothetical protein [Candidatus Coatesbacteria bacterium]